MEVASCTKTSHLTGVVDIRLGLDIRSPLPTLFAFFGRFCLFCPICHHKWPFLNFFLYYFFWLLLPMFGNFGPLCSGFGGILGQFWQLYTTFGFFLCVFLPVFGLVSFWSIYHLAPVCDKESNIVKEQPKVAKQKQTWTTVTKSDQNWQTAVKRTKSGQKQPGMLSHPPSLARDPRWRDSLQDSSISGEE